MIEFAAFVCCLAAFAGWLAITAEPSKRPPPVYVAAPFAPADPLDSRANTERAVAIADWYASRGHRVVCVHPAILRGRYGDDTDPIARSRGMLRTLAKCRAVARAGGTLAVLRLPEGALSHGTAAEVQAFLEAGGSLSRVQAWAWPLDEATAHRVPA